MYSSTKIEKMITLILIVGTLISICLVMTGGIIYLLENGNTTLASTLLKSNNYHLNINSIWQNIQSFSSIGLIELGLLSLVTTQILRVGLLCWFYIITKDYWFIGFSMFILAILIYSSFWRNSI